MNKCTYVLSKIIVAGFPSLNLTEFRGFGKGFPDN